MTIYCILCKKESIPGYESRSFHKFPNNQDLKKRWLEAVELSSVTKHTKICSDHFDVDCFHDTGGLTRIRRLLPTAVPSITTSKKVLNVTKEICTSSTQTEYVQDASSINIEADNGALVKIASSDGQQNCQTEFNELFLNKLAQYSTNVDHSYCTHTANESDNIEETSITNNHFTEVLQDNKLMIMKNICDVNNSTPTTDNTKNLTRFPLPIDVSGIPPSKKFCFIDGIQTTHISREDFISHDAWIRFLKFTVFKNRQVEASNKKIYRKNQRIENIKELIKNLREERTIEEE